MKFKILLFAAFIFLLNIDAHAQLIWNQNIDMDKVNISMEWGKPIFEENDKVNEDIGFFTSTMFIQGYVPVVGGFAIVGDIPISHRRIKEKEDGIYIQKPHTTVGNIYIGGRYRFKKAFNNRLQPYIEVGTRLSAMPDPDYPDKMGFLTGYLSSLDRREAFYESITPTMAFLHLDYAINPVVTLSVGGGTTYWTETVYIGFEDKNTHKKRIYLNQNLQINFTTPEFGGSVGLTGKFNITSRRSDELYYRDKMVQLRGGINKNFNLWNIEAFVRAPLLDAYPLQSVLGFKVNYKFSTSK